MNKSLLFLSLLLLGCATSHQRWTDDISPNLASEKVLDVPFFPQEENMCGPVVLKMATSFSAPQYSLAELKKMTFREEVNGTFQSDILAAARRMGLTPYRVSHSHQIWRQINDGRPVMVFQNLAVSWLPAWHFSLVVGYNASLDKVYLHTGTEALQSLGLKRFLATWERGEHWAYVVSDPSDIPSSAPFSEALDNAMLLENIGQTQAALRVYLAMTEQFPDRFEPHLGLAQISFAQGRLPEALQEAEIALSKSPAHPALLFNLSVLYFKNGQTQKARELKRQTLARALPEDREDYEKRFSF